MSDSKENKQAVQERIQLLIDMMTTLKKDNTRLSKAVSELSLRNAQLNRLLNKCSSQTHNIIVPSNQGNRDTLVSKQQHFDLEYKQK